MPYYGAIEAGGTKIVCAIASDPDNIIKEIILPTETPEITLSRMADFFLEYQQQSGKKITSLGIGCFGSLELDKSSPQYGHIINTSKAEWKDTNIVGYLSEKIKAPIIFETKDNAAAYCEYKWGTGKGLETLFYMTIGTEIGGGVIVNGELIHGLMHPEPGHITVKKHPDDHFEGRCQYHENCLEGLASAKSVDVRWNCHALELGNDHPAWELEAYYIAQALATCIHAISPQKIILGGGLMNKQCLFPLIRKKVKEMLNGYISHESILSNIDEYIVPSDFRNKAGITGALALAMEMK